MLVCALVLAGGGSARAQEEPKRFRRSAIYVEGFGQGILYSVNYDHRLTPHISFRAGFTRWSIPFFFLAVGELTFTGFPIMANYQSGEGSDHLELGIGVMPAIFSFQGREIFFGTEIDGGGTIVLGTATVGYRLQRYDGGLVFRISVTPLFTFEEARLTGGISLGFAF